MNGYECMMREKGNSSCFNLLLEENNGLFLHLKVQ